MKLSAINTVACLGTGTMGHGVAFLAAHAGYQVRMFGRSAESIARGLAGVDRVIATYEQNGLLPENSGSTIKARITGVITLEHAAEGAQLVIESVAEDLQIKHEVFKIMESLCTPGTLLATNTSSLSLTEISKCLKHPENFLALHFFNPPHLATLAEVCPCSSTSPAIIKQGTAWIESLGHTPININQEIKGLIINRLQSALLREALYIVEQGWASAETVDKAMVLSLGRRYAETGPIETADMGGLDVFNKILDELPPVLCAGVKSPDIVRNTVKQGNLGMKTGKGLYNWTEARIKTRRAAREKVLLSFLKRDRDL
jgi:3-hydroxybutyryl-CoA dehydrogenase